MLDVESPYLIRLETQLRSRDWGGVIRADAEPRLLCQDAEFLARWSLNPVSEWSIGWEGMGSTRLRFRVVNGKGDLMCQVELQGASESRHTADGPVARVSYEFHTEPGLVECFARHLRAIGTHLEGEAILEGTI